MNIYRELITMAREGKSEKEMREVRDEWIDELEASGISHDYMLLGIVVRTSGLIENKDKIKKAPQDDYNKGLQAYSEAYEKQHKELVEV